MHLPLLIYIENTDTLDHKFEGYFKTSPAIAFSGLMGLDLPLSEKVTAFFEASFKQMSFKLKSRQTTDNSTEIIFEKDSENNPAPIRIPGSNLGLRIGIRLQIIKMEREQGVY